MNISSINPANGRLLKTYQSHTAAEAKAKIDQTHTAWQSYRETSFNNRAEFLKNASGILSERKQELAELMALEMGKPINQGIAEIEKCAGVCDFYAENAARFLANEEVKTEAGKSYVTFKPVGVILAVMPWNFPFWQVFRFLSPALMAGNCAVLKHASNVPGCALAIEEIIKDSGFPEFVFQSLLVDSKAVDTILENEYITAVTLTGSVAAGKKVAEKAGSLLKKMVLELGGSDAYIVLEDADLELAAETCVTSRLLNGGQSCICAKRFIVVEKVQEDFLKRVKQKMADQTMGDPLSESTDIGPQARNDLRDELHKQVLESIEKGAICILGGEIPAGDGAFYPPSILTSVKKGMPAYDEELFGPVASVITVRDEQEAIRVANDTVFGLGACVFSNDVERAERLAAEKLEAGSCFVNAFVRSDPRLPFGGIKQSGFGRELGVYGIKEFVNIKTVYIK